MVSTRSRRQAEMQELVYSTPLQEVRRLRTVAEVIAFVEVALLNPEVGTVVTELAIVPSLSSLDRDALERYLPECLALTPNVTIFEILVYPAVPIAGLGRGLLPYVEVLRTNLPHRALVPFLSLHPTLRALELGPCGRARRCALSSLSLQHINDIRAPADCVANLAHNEVDRIRVDVGRSSILASIAISNLPGALTALHVLTVEFSAHDVAILCTIAARLPNVRNLKLLEKSHTSVPKHKQRPWTDRSRWAASLQKLVQLDRLVIRTAGALCAHAGDPAAERDIFRRWVGIDHPHSTLHYIGVWQCTSGDSDGILSEWSREDGVWMGKWTDEPHWGQVGAFW